jgi:ABC-type iron transport system FetAB ATPase subunit
LKLACANISTSVLKACSLTADAGEIVTLRGGSGSGKTLFLRALADLDPHEGTVRLDGIEQANILATTWRRRVRFVAAEAAWWTERVGDHFRASDAAASVTELGLPPNCMEWEVSRLSTGEKQRLGFLRAIEDHPEVLLLDEPTAALDSTAGRAVERLIERHRTAGAAIVLVTHSDEQETRLGSRRFVIAAGRLREAS